MWHTIAQHSEVKEGKVYFREINGRIVVYGKFRGNYFAFDSRCPHKGGPLQQGKLIDGKVKCPWHGYTFDVFTGKHGRIPYPKRYGRWRETGNLKVYKTRIKGPSLQLYMPEK